MIIEEYPALTRPFVHESNEALVPALDKIVGGLVNNPNFPTLTDQILDYQKVVEDFRIKQADASSTKGKNAIIARNEARVAVVKATIAIGNAVVEAANGNFAAVASTNLPMRKPGQPVTPGGPENIRLTDSKINGTLDIKVKRPKGSFMVIARYTAAPVTEKSVWTTVNSRVAKFSISGLETAKKYYVQLGIMGKGNITIWAETALSPLIS